MKAGWVDVSFPGGRLKNAGDCGVKMLTLRRETQRKICVQQV
jgi:hypothetical protein